MQKNQILGIILITAVVFLYLTVLMPKYYKQPPPPVNQTLVSKDSTKTAGDVTPSSDGKSAAASTSETTTTPTSDKQTLVPDINLLAKDAKEIVVDADLYRARFSTLGGRLVSFKLKKIHIDALASVSELEKEYEAIKDSSDPLKVASVSSRLALAKEIEDLQKKEKEARAAGKTAEADTFKSALEATGWVELINSNNDLPKPFQIDYSGIQGGDLATLYSTPTDHVTMSKSSPDAVLILTGKLPNGLVVEKKLSFQNASYAMQLDLNISNPTDKSFRMASADGTGLKLYAGSGLGDMQMFTQSKYDIVPQASGKVDKKVKVIPVSVKNLNNQVTGDITWAGLETNYFFKGWVPILSMTSTVGAEYSQSGKLHSPSLWLSIPSLDIPSKDINKQSYLFYIGPKQLDKLGVLKVPVEEIIFPGMLQTINLWLLYLLKWCFAVTKNYGIAVILISVIIKVVTFPLNHISYKSMKAMQILAPEVKLLQEKYKDDPARQQKEMMELYRKNKVNPMSGCFPMLLQMPIFFSLYQVLGKVIELRGAPFFGWIHDLSKPDTITVIAGMPINILPLLMGATMWVQQKMTTTPDPKSAMMSQFMTIFFLFIFWNMPSGLVLYWFVQNLLSILQQHYINKQDIPIHLSHSEANA